MKNMNDGPTKLFFQKSYRITISLADEPRERNLFGDLHQRQDGHHGQNLHLIENRLRSAIKG